MHVKPGDRFDQGFVGDVAGSPGCQVQDVGQTLQPSRGEQEGAHREAGPYCPPNDLLPLGKEQAVLGLEVPAQLNVAQPDIVREPTVGGVGYLDESGDDGSWCGDPNRSCSCCPF